METHPGLRALWTAAQVRAIDRLSTEQYGIASLALMEQAGRAVYETCLELRQPFQKILILAGPGNNGGDALVAARYLFQAGFAPEVWSVAEPSSRETSARLQQRIACEQLGMLIYRFGETAELPRYEPELFVIDGVLGLGLTEPLRQGLYRDLLTAVADLKPQQVLAIDLPSGLLADSWSAWMPPLKANYTLSFGAAKPVHLLSPGRQACGKVLLRAIDFAPAAIEECFALGPRLWSSPNYAKAVNPWQQLSPEAHKYIRGHGLVIGGSPGKVGACYLAAQGALRAGAGWISVAPLADQQAPSYPPSLTYESWALSGVIAEEALENFIRQRKVKGLIIGPGCMNSPLSPSLLRRLQHLNQQEGLFLVFDAGALRGWAKLAEGLCFDPLRTLLTPHPGEWRTLAPEHEDLDHVSKLAAAWEFAERYGVTVFYKTATPFSLWKQSGDSQLCLNTDGDHRLARAGTGDLLSGVCLALGMLGMSAPQLAPLAQSILARAVDLASQQHSGQGLSSEELMPYLCVT